MNSARVLTTLIFFALVASTAHAMSADEERLRGFAEHQKNNEQFGKAREKGERAYLEEQEQWEIERNRNLDAYRQVKKAQTMNDDGPEAKAFEAEQRKYQADYDKVRREYSEQRAQDAKLERRDKNLPSEEQELGLDEQRPRFEWAKRKNFGGRASSSSASSGGFSRPSTPSSGGTSFPPPPTFDDFDNSGYVPAPNVTPEDFGDVPPPPPPPAPLPNDFGNDFPPPPAAPFGEEGAGDF